jgi:hypothetical protein
MRESPQNEFDPIDYGINNGTDSAAQIQIASPLVVSAASIMRQSPIRHII